jgi:hypothetical protein
MRIRTITTGATFAGYESDTSVPGQVGRDGNVVNHYTEEAYDCDYVVNTLGDFGGDAYLNSGQMMNRVICEDGTVVTYHIYHESHPAYSGERESIWGSWEYFDTVNKVGQDS